MFKSLLTRLLGSLTAPSEDAAPKQLACGTPVNHVRRGHVVRCDGVVIGATSQGVLVEWCTGGSSRLPREELCVIAA